jgi:hypothetical protein
MTESAGAPITYVSAQLAHANPSTTLRFYARWMPTMGESWVDLLDRSEARVARAEGVADGRFVRFDCIAPVPCLNCGGLEPFWNQSEAL